MGGGTGGGGGTGPPQTFQRLTLCLWVVHGKNRLQMVLVPQSSRRGAALGVNCEHMAPLVNDMGYLLYQEFKWHSTPGKWSVCVQNHHIDHEN